MKHTLKTWPGPFQAVVEGTKHHEIRKFDRPYAVGDMLVLQEWDPSKMAYTGRELRAVVTYISPPGTWGLPTDLGVMSIRPLSQPN